jgi:glycine C-acetyltransferase
LRQKGRPYLFSNSLPTHVVAAYIKALDILEGSPDLIPKLHRNVKQFRDGMTELGFEIMGNPESAIVPGKMMKKVKFKFC